MDPDPFDSPPLSGLDLISQHNKSVAQNDQVMHSNLSAFIVDIQRNINQLNFRFFIERIQKRNESASTSPMSKKGRSRFLFCTIKIKYKRKS